MYDIQTKITGKVSVHPYFINFLRLAIFLHNIEGARDIHVLFLLKKESCQMIQKLSYVELAKDFTWEEAVRSYHFDPNQSFNDC